MSAGSGDGTDSPARTALDVLRTFDPGLMRQAAALLGVDAADPDTGLDLAAVEITSIAWRNGPVDAWQRRSSSRTSNGEMLRADAATTRLARSLMESRPLDRHPGPEDAGSAHRPDLVFAATGDALSDSDRRLPDGRQMAAVAPHRRQLNLYRHRVRGACRRWTEMAAEIGPELTLLFLACCAAATFRQWWLGLDRPGIVDDFIGRLGTVSGAESPRTGMDRSQLRRLLLDGPDLLDADTTKPCARVGLSFRTSPQRFAA